MKFRYSLSCFLVTLAVLAGNAALAQTAVTIDYDTKAFQSRKLKSGAIEVSVSYQPYKPGEERSEDDKNLSYQISYNGQVKIKDGDFTAYSGEVSLQDLDGDRTPEVLISSYSGGAHCCTNTKVYSWRNNQFTKAETGFLDGQGGRFEDLNGDRTLEFVSYDNGFLYMFSSYAGSFPPSAIYAFRNGQFEDVTRSHPKHLRTQLQAMFKAFQERRKEQGEVNGLLAGYVAQKAMVGEFQQGWNFMLANYDRSSTWGLTRYDDKGREVGRYANFPAALRAFLIRQGYLDAQGRPR